jgi:heme oxygenase
MNTLKELTWDSHKQAEQTEIMRQLLADTIQARVYCELLYTKYEIYRAIENRVKFETADLPRAQRALNDWQTLGCHMPRCMVSLDTYVMHLNTISEHDLWAHVYVHYLAPLYGGQIIKKRISHRLPVTLYEFEDPQAAISEVRSHVSVTMASEANLAFEATRSYYEDLMKQHGAHT